MMIQMMIKSITSHEEVMLREEGSNKYCTKNIVAYRYGGEEFAILFLEKNATDAFDVLQNILNEFRKHNFN